MKVTMRRITEPPHDPAFECVVERTDDKEVARGGFKGTNAYNVPASGLLYNVSKVLILRGYDLHKTSPETEAKHGNYHLTSVPYFLAPRIRTKAPHIFIWNANYALWDEGELFNRHGVVHLQVVLDVFDKQPNCADLIEALEANAPEPVSTVGLHRWALWEQHAQALAKGLEALRTPALS